MARAAGEGEARKGMRAPRRWRVCERARPRKLRAAICTGGCQIYQDAFVYVYVDVYVYASMYICTCIHVQPYICIHA